MVEDLRQLLEQLGIKSANIVGHDLGGVVAYVYAAKHRDRLSRLGIIEAPIRGVPSPTMQRVLASYWHIGFYAHPRLPELLIAGRERDYLAEFIRTNCGHWVIEEQPGQLLEGLEEFLRQ
jgi:pimeloyl-ACP methyl ester carboxylesterase